MARTHWPLTLAPAAAPAWRRGNQTVKVLPAPGSLATLEATVVQLDEAPGQGQAQARPFLRPAGTHLVELLEDPDLVLGS